VDRAQTIAMMIVFELKMQLPSRTVATVPIVRRISSRVRARTRLRTRVIDLDRSGVRR